MRQPDLLDVYSIIQDGRRDAPGPALPWAVLDGLQRLIGCDVVAFVELDLSRRIRPVQQTAVIGGHHAFHLGPDEDPNVDTLFWEHYQGFWAARRSIVRGAPEGVLRWSDMFSRSDLLAQPLYEEFFRPDKLKHCMLVELPALPGHTRRVLFWRLDGQDFTDQARVIVELLRPHLFEIYQDARRRRPDRPALTPRERQVLELAAQGRSNADIARLLVTSVSTVRKHMEHIFDRTGVRTRGEAIAKMLS